ncbi:uncharacterized protein LOC133191554 [Saccostrea echinata]|uniref:uncharacterized protein LOC133191554 n=1 Tax=Saccostrea echinata TaxID=191078 RepID=UPI002A813A7B|nr:uncharacterized protein LOC133191554 [Saccostrea echinata]
MTWTSRYSEKWPRLTALFHLDNGVDADIHENGRYETAFQEPPSEPFYKFYLHPDDIGRGRSVSQYSMQDAGRVAGQGSGKTCNMRVFLGTVLLFSVAGVVAVAVTLAVLLSQPHGSSHTSSKFADDDLSKDMLSSKEGVLSRELCGLMKNLFKLDANENRPVQDCSVSLSIQDGHMKVNFKVPATDKLMQEEIEKIKQNVLKNIKDIDIGLGVVSNTDDVSIYKKDDKQSTTVEIILTTTKPLSGVTASTTSRDTVTKTNANTTASPKPTTVKDEHMAAIETQERVESKDKITTDSTADIRTTTEMELPDHTSIDDVAFLSHLNKTVKDLIQNFDLELGVTKDPTENQNHLVNDFEHLKQHLGEISLRKLDHVTSTSKSVVDGKDISSFEHTNHDKFDLNLDTNDTFNFTGLPFLKANSKAKGEIMIKNVSLDHNDTNSNRTNNFSDDRTLNITDITNTTKSVANGNPLSTKSSDPLNDSYYNTYLNDWWKLEETRSVSKELETLNLTKQYRMTVSSFISTTAASIDPSEVTQLFTMTNAHKELFFSAVTTSTTPSLQSLELDTPSKLGDKINDQSVTTATTASVRGSPGSMESTPKVTTKDTSSVDSTSIAATKTTTSLQDLYQDFLWNFGSRLSTTSKPYFHTHDHTAHSFPHTEKQHNELFGLSRAPMHFTKQTIGSELTLTEESTFNFDGLSLDLPNKNETAKQVLNKTSQLYDITNLHTHDEYEPHNNSNFPSSLPDSIMSTNELFQGIEKLDFEGLTFDAHISPENNWTLSNTGDTHTKTSNDEQKQVSQTKMEQVVEKSYRTKPYSLITPTKSISLTYENLRSFSSTVSGIGSQEPLQGFSENRLKSLEGTKTFPNNVLEATTNSYPATKEVIVISSTSSTSYSTKYEQMVGFHPHQNNNYSQNILIVTPSLKTENIQSVEVTSSMSGLVERPTHATQDLSTIQSSMIYSSSFAEMEDSSVSLHSSNKGFVLEDSIFPQQLSFPEQRLIDHTLLKLPIMSAQLALDSSLSTNHHKSHQVNGFEVVTPLTKSSNVPPQRHFSINKTESTMPSFEEKLIPFLETSLQLGKTSIISSLSTLSPKKPSVSQDGRQNGELPSKSIYFPVYLDITKDSTLVSQGVQSPETDENYFIENKPSNIQFSILPSIAKFSVQYPPVSLPISSPKPSSFTLHKSTSMPKLSSVLQEKLNTMDNFSSKILINPTKTAGFMHQETHEKQGTKIITFESSILSMKEANATSIPGSLIPSSSGLNIESILKPDKSVLSNDMSLSLNTLAFPMDIATLTFPDQNWNRDQVLHTNQHNSYVKTSAKNDTVPISFHFLRESSIIYSSRSSLSYGSTSVLTLALDSSTIKPLRSEDIGVFETNIPWDALDIKPTKSTHLFSSSSQYEMENIEGPPKWRTTSPDTLLVRKHEKKSTALYPSSSFEEFYTKTSTESYHKTQSISVYTVTHEPIMYLTIDTRPLMESSLSIQPTPRVSFQATFFRDRKKLEDLPNQGRRGILRIKSVSKSPGITTTESPVNVDVTTARPKLTAAQVAGLRKNLARMRAARMRNFRRRQNLLARMQSGIMNDFPLRRQISGSNTANTLLGRGLDVSDRSRRKLQRPTASPRVVRTTQNPRQRIDRNRLFPGFNTGNQFNQNFFNNIRWNG